MSEILSETRMNSILYFGWLLVPTEYFKAVPQCTCPLAPNRYRTIFWKSHVQIECLIRVDCEYFAHLVLELEQLLKWKGKLAVLWSLFLMHVVNDQAVRVASYQVFLIDASKFKAGDSWVMVSDLLDIVGSWLCIQVENSEWVVKVATNKQFICLLVVDLKHIVKVITDPLIPELQIIWLFFEMFLCKSLLAQIHNNAACVLPFVISILDSNKH